MRLLFWQIRETVWPMAVRAFLDKYAGTLGGVSWAIINPLAVVAVFWFVFSVGFKAQGPDNMPFVVYFITGLAPWLFFAEVVQGNVTAITANPHLVTKVVFPTHLLPVATLISGMMTSFIVLFIAIIIPIPIYNH